MQSYSNQPLHQLRDIHRMMERTSKFIGLSGLSGVSAGLFALVGALLIQWYLVAGGWESYGHSLRYFPFNEHPWGWSPVEFFVIDAAFVLIGAVTSAVYFTTRRAQRKGQAIWDALTQRLLWSLIVPLGVGGVFVLAMLYHGLGGIVAPATLIFYGLALINAAKYTLEDVYYLGISEVVLGCVGLFFLGWGLVLWALGFGLLHIVYGLLMYYKYERLT